ncbi:MAG: UDP-3-O-(3-hydroxymyristoyl)glucosamine N-acyltransferase [Bdellovibrionaceae bacterium]|nr:UDP-3-O-(3-hydroxymyristoyl)glucosamine N-acyltransferase [Bdellovibrio sp.]
MKSISSQQISECGQSGNTNAAPPTLQLQQNTDIFFKDVQPPHLASETSLVFAANKILFQTGADRKALGFIINESAFKEIQPLITPAMSVWTTRSIPQAMSIVLSLFDRKKEFITGGVHSTAVIHPTAKVSPTASIGPFCVVEAHAVIGDNTVLTSHVFIGAFCEIGARCHLASHVSIGSDGFGFFTDKKNIHHKIPQVGRVIIEDDCELGAFCALDRATLTETRLGKGCKVDNYCHFGHNVTVGENGIMAASFKVAGSTRIGKNLLAGGSIDLNGHIEITDNVVLSGRAGVTSSISEPGIYGGFPLETHRESVKTLVSIPHIKKLKKQVRQILKHLQLNEED